MPTPEIFTSIMNSYFPEPHASLINGILFGIPLQKSTLFYTELRIVGLLHIVVLSGINITLLAVFIALTTSRFGKSISLVITILTIILFILFVRPQAPVVRAGIMGIVTFVAVFVGRKSVALYSLLLSAFIIALFWPQWLTSLSFHLSFMATLGLILFGSKSDYLSRGSNLNIGRASSFVYQDIRISFAAQIFTVPIIFLAFREISLISPLANLLVAFTIAPLMLFGFLTAFLGKVDLMLGLPSALICYGILQYIITVVHFLSKFPFASMKF